MQIINSTDINVNGTSKQRTFRATYWELIEAFGEPATIYDWKSSIAPEDNSTWNIGGFKQSAAWKIIDVLEKKAVA